MRSGGQIGGQGTEQTCTQCDDITVGQFRLAGVSNLSVMFEEALAITQLPKETAESIWRKVAMLITESNAITFAPRLGSRDRMVKSKSGSTPHLVTASKDAQYRCDDRCPQHKSLGICSHSVAAAESNGKLRNSLNCTARSSTSV